MMSDNEQIKEYDGEYFGNKPGVFKKKIFYLCNGKKCGDACSEECKRTSDVNYAKNYMNEPPNKTLEKHFNKHEMILDAPTIIWEEKDGES